MLATECEEANKEEEETEQRRCRWRANTLVGYSLCFCQRCGLIGLRGAPCWAGPVSFCSHLNDGLLRLVLPVDGGQRTFSMLAR